jgi:hypothetical protein
MSNQSRWVKNMIDISVSDEYKDAILEWEKGMLPPFKGVGNCLCGARMKNFHLITNKYNNNTVFAGSSCLKKIDIHITKKIGGTNALLHYNGEMPIFDILDMPKYLEQCSEIIRKLKEQDEQERLRIEHQDEHPVEERLRQLHCIEEERLMKEKEINKLEDQQEKERLQNILPTTEERMDQWRKEWREQERLKNMKKKLRVIAEGDLDDTADLYRSMRVAKSKERRMMKEKEINTVKRCCIKTCNELDNALCYVIRLGKYKNTNLFTVYVNDRSYFRWLNNNIDKGNTLKAINIIIKQEKLLNKRIKSLDRTLIKLLQ